jgi:hypothetical protein
MLEVTGAKSSWPGAKNGFIPTRSCGSALPTVNTSVYINQRSFLTQVGNVIGRRPAAVPCHDFPFRVEGDEVIFGLGQRIVNPQWRKLDARQLLGLLPRWLLRGHGKLFVKGMNRQQSRPKVAKRQSETAVLKWYSAPCGVAKRKHAPRGLNRRKAREETSDAKIKQDESRHSSRRRMQMRTAGSASKSPSRQRRASLT